MVSNFLINVGSTNDSSLPGLLIFSKKHLEVVESINVSSVSYMEIEGLVDFNCNGIRNLAFEKKYWPKVPDFLEVRHNFVKRKIFLYYFFI